MDWGGPFVPVEVNPNCLSALRRLRYGNHTTDIPLSPRTPRLSKFAQSNAIAHTEADRFRLFATFGALGHSANLYQAKAQATARHKAQTQKPAHPAVATSAKIMSP